MPNAENFNYDQTLVRKKETKVKIKCKRVSINIHKRCQRSNVPTDSVTQNVLVQVNTQDYNVKQQKYQGRQQPLQSSVPYFAQNWMIGLTKRLIVVPEFSQRHHKHAHDRLHWVIEWTPRYI